MTQFTVTPTHDYVPFWSLLLFPGISLFWLMARDYRVSQEVVKTTPFGTSALILFSLLVAGAAGIVAIYYSKWLFDQAYRVKVNLYSYIPVMALSGGAIAVLGVSLWRFSTGEGRMIILDILYLIALIGVPAGCIGLAVGVGNHVSTLRRNAGFIAMGLWHGIIQLLYPIILIWLGGGTALGIALISAVVFTSISVFAIKLFPVNVLINRWVLSILWFVYGLWMLLIPFIWAGPPGRPDQVAILSMRVVILGSALLAGVIGAALADFSTLKKGLGTIAGAALGGGLAGWIAYAGFSERAGTCVLAGLIGAVMSCVWLGWYFAVALVFDGHANEAGSTARTEQYKHFIRFRVRKDSLTGFVIGVDYPHAPQDGEPDRRDGATLKPRLVDVFTLKCNSKPPMAWEDIEENPA